VLVPFFHLVVVIRILITGLFFDGFPQFTGHNTVMTACDPWVFTTQLTGNGTGSPPPFNFEPAAATSDKPTWLHGDYQNDEIRGWIAEKLKLSPLVSRALIDANPKPRCLSTEQGLLVILRGVNLNPQSNPEDMVALRIWIQEGLIITLRHRRVMAAQEIIRRLDKGEGPKDIPDWLIQCIQRMLDLAHEVVQNIDDKVDEMEETVLGSEDRHTKEDFADLRRSIVRLRRHLAPQRELFSNLESELPHWLKSKLKAPLKEFTHKTSRLIEDLDSARDRAAITQETWSHQSTERMNRTMYLLSIITAIFLPLGLVTGLLGVNVGGIPGADNQHAFFILCGLMLMMGLGVWWALRKNRWL
jgi:zinc transporter